MTSTPYSTKRSAGPCRTQGGYRATSSSDHVKASVSLQTSPQYCKTIGWLAKIKPLRQAAKILLVMRQLNPTTRLVDTALHRQASTRAASRENPVRFR